MTNFLLLPIILPFLTAILLMFAPKNIIYQRTLTMIGLIITTGCSLALIQIVHTSGIQVVTFGNWPAPFGISMVADMVAVLLITTSVIITLFTVVYSFKSIGIAREKFFYYPGVLLMLTGVNGAFMTGDIFNLFVFFEVLLMASYLLSVIGGEKKQLRESMKYILVNVVSSALFVITVALLYSVVGTLNMADISVKIAEINQPGIITTIGILFLVVFGLKAAIFPLFFWLPSSYAAPPVPVLALFGALLTKVGVYAIMRTYTLFFVHDIGYTHMILLVLSVLTILAGCIGALSTFNVKNIIIYNIVIAVGVILFGVAQMNDTSMIGAMYYLVHDMLIKAALFFLVGIMIFLTGTENLRKMGGMMRSYPSLAWTYLIAAFGLAGIPPLSGFIGKMLIVKGGFEADHIWSSIWILLSSLVVLLSVIRIFIYGFWGEEKRLVAVEKRQGYWRLYIPATILVAITVFYGVGAEWIMPYMRDAADVLLNPSVYTDAVLKE
ncbi:Na+/H+ antiporter subunit D [Kurthia sibirica]|uniref:Na+/H+ antiporter subunit D n=1 Tax=Kurthia sibirica TaxID=202750 RepID=A0A2U3AI82_9BACL|nr:Na+/H+ antiporter subunit D [Kurthia sibirica]PWI24161.1 Na+/H+ antiporter subunit D [Kurthia sibirica]GEK34685.1 Na(+)/H(+) antiporter subunit D [Kurthia sibirica]